MECPKCEGKMYGYGDVKHVIYLCWSDGAYLVFSEARNMDEFVEFINYNPLFIMDMIKNKTLKPLLDKS